MSIKQFKDPLIKMKKRIVIISAILLSTIIVAVLYGSKKNKDSRAPKVVVSTNIHKTVPEEKPSPERVKLRNENRLKIEFALSEYATKSDLYEAISIMNYWYADEVEKPEEVRTLLKHKLDSLMGYTFSSKPYTSLNKIDAELHKLYDDLYNSVPFDSQPYALETFTERLKFHLSNPLIFNNNLPKTSSLISILKTPDKRYKFYSFNECEQGTVSWHSTYVQYIDRNRNLVFHKWDETEDDGKDADGLLTKIWQFKHKTKDYYVSQKYFGSSSGRTLSIAIFTISDGKPTYHTEFYPEGVSQAVSSTLNYKHELYFDFNPQTLTVSYTTYDDDNQSAGKKIKGSWKLVLN